MELDDLPKKEAPLSALTGEDLSTTSLEELAERKATLLVEISRIEEMIASKMASRDAADAVFK
ncbi:MAG: DUF1192 domain-containing protein [Sphingomonadales bacterium]